VLVGILAAVPIGILVGGGQPATREEAVVGSAQPIVPSSPVTRSGKLVPGGAGALPRAMDSVASAASGSSATPSAQSIQPEASGTAEVTGGSGERRRMRPMAAQKSEAMAPSAGPTGPDTLRVRERTTVFEADTRTVNAK
jgi:hypothetical protein